MSVNIVNKQTGELQTVAGSGGSGGQTIQVDTLPTASASLEGNIYQYVGASTLTLTNGYFYKCVEGETTGIYEWIEVQVQEGGSGGQTIQVTSLPTASSENVGTVYQYIGSTTQDYIHNYFYECVLDNGTYKWVNTNVQSSSGGQATSREEIVISTASNFRAGQGSYSFKTSTAVTITLNDASTITIPANIQGFLDVGETDSTLNDYIGVIQYTYNGYEKIIYFNSTVFYLPSTDNVQIDDENVSSATTYSSSKIETAIGGSKASQMTGATAYQDGKAGLATKPVAGDNQKALFGDGQYHTIYAANTGSTVVVVTDEPTLYGRTVTLTAGSTTLTGTLSNTGECTFTNLALYGAVNISATDSEGNPAKGSTNISYFGTYVVGIGFNFATIKFTSSDIALSGTPVLVYLGNNVVAETSLASDGQGGLEAVCYVEQIGLYKAVSNTSKGTARGNVVVSSLNQTFTKELIIANIYGFKINKNDSNTDTCISAYDLSDYDVINVGFTPAHMDYTNDVFDYGSWTALATCDRSQVFFAPKPCMLNYDGTVAYYLSPTNFSKKANGTTSDIDDDTFGGNAMIEFPTIWIKRWEDSGYVYVLIADRQIDIDFEAYAHHDVNGNILDNIYLPMYKGWSDGTRLRSLSGKSPTANTTRQQEITTASANNDVSEQGEGWYILHKAEWDMVNNLLLLIGMNFNTQTVFGNGVVSGSSSGVKPSGMFNNKGMFYGTSGTTDAVVVFGIENWWGNIATSCAGWMTNKTTQIVKMTYGTEDGSTSTGYNTDGSGYISSVPAVGGSSASYIKTYSITANGFFPTGGSGSSTTYTCDACYGNSSQNNYALIGGSTDHSYYAGAFFIMLHSTIGIARWFIGASITYKGIVSQAQQGGNS